LELEVPSLGDADSFMDKDKYVADKILAFLEKWAPKKKV
jgi:hypothetical protein